MNLLKEIYVSYESAQKLRKLPALQTACEFTLFKEGADYSKYMKESLDPSCIDALEAFPKDPNVTALIVRGLPIDANLPTTPYTNAGTVLSVPLASAINIGLYQLMKIFPVTYQGENEGRIFRDVSPKLNAVHEKSSYGSTQTLGMHVDNCHLPLTPEVWRTNLAISPEYLSLCGLRCDLRVPTRVSFVDLALEKLDQETIELLKQPLYELTMPDSFASHEKFILPVLVQDSEGMYHARFDKEYTRPISESAKEAFDKFEKALYHPDALRNLYLQGGDFLIFKNQRLTHSREGFTPRFDGTDRWLLRLFGVNSQERIVPVEENNLYYLKSY